MLQFLRPAWISIIAACGYISDVVFMFLSQIFALMRTGEIKLKYETSMLHFSHHQQVVVDSHLNKYKFREAVSLFHKICDSTDIPSLQN